MKNTKISIGYVVFIIACFLTGLVLALLLLPVSKSEGAEPPADAQHIVIHMDRDKTPDDKVSRTMDIDNPETDLSGITSINGDVALMELFSTITMVETRSFWRDTQVLDKKYNVKKIRIFMNSGGGSAMDGLALADMILEAQRDGFEIEIYATGVCASAAVTVFAACNKRTASAGCMFMVHEAKLFKLYSQETMDDLESQKEMMTLLRTRYLDILAKRSKLSVKEWSDLLATDTWFSAEQALQWGLVDEIR